MPKTTLEEAFLRAEELRKRVEENVGSSIPELTDPITISIGVAQSPRDASGLTGLMKASEAALWFIKDAGRNRAGLPVAEEMVLKSCQYSSSSLRRLKALAEKQGKTESTLLREALADLLQKYDE